MIKPFHELTKEEFKGIVDSKKYTWEKLAKDYPQPEWCQYPDATAGQMGCFSLMWHLVKDKNYCKNCECSKEYKKED